MGVHNFTPLLPLIIMKVILLLCLAGVALGFPGGYIAKGGVFNFGRPLDYLDAGKAAGKFAWNKKFEDELDVGATQQQERGTRNAAYIPTFFTSQKNHQALTDARNPDKRQTTNQEPLYYETYHRRK